jgi:D-beta-D-heptose 7-phosphate kinase / D-beta-D-heptose 1-phosphate adenosyltransferase
MPLLNLPDLVHACNDLRREGRRIVFTNGVFDILHAGHVSYLEEARALGDALVVGVNSDASVRRLKGPERPIVEETDRARLIAALRAVDHAVIFGEDTPFELIRMVRPDVLVKGGDYDPDATEGKRYIVGSDLVKSTGGEVRVLTFVDGRSTTDIVRRILTQAGRSHDTDQTDSAPASGS